MPILADDTTDDALPPADAQHTAWLAHDDAPATRVTLVHDAHTRGLALNEAAARALVIHRRWSVSQERLAASVDVARQWSPEEKLLRAIFGEKADSVAIEGLDEEGLPTEGAEITRGAQVLCDPRSRSKVHFTPADAGTIRAVERAREGLAAGVGERVTVRVERTDTASIGDALVRDGTTLGVVTRIIDDGASDPRVYGSFDAPSREASLSIGTPTALAACEPCEDPAQPGILGERIPFATIARLVERGCLGLATDFASHHCDPSPAMFSVRESLMQRGTIAHPFSSAPREAPVRAMAEGSIFDFFERPKARTRSTAALERATAYARALGATLVHDGDALRLEPRADPTEGSEGDVQGDLGDPRLFGPRKDYECECGALRRMKHRGQRCKECGVVVESSAQRRALFAHIALSSPLDHPLTGASTSALPVLPPALRGANDPTLESRYARALATRDPEDALAVLDLLLTRLCEAIRSVDAPVSAMSGGAIALVEPSLDPWKIVAPASVLARMAAPLLLFAIEQAGYSATIVSSRKLLKEDEEVRATVLRWLVQTRPLLVHRDGDRVAQPCAAWAVKSTENPVFYLGTSLADALGARTGDRLIAHLPLSDAAVREAVWLADAPGAARLREASAVEGWVDSLAYCAESERRRRLSEALRTRASDPCTSPNAAWLVGGYALDDDAGLVDLPAIPVIERESGRDEAPSKHAWLARSVDDLEVSVRTANALQKMGIATIGALVERSETALKAGGMGPKSISELKQILADMGLYLGTKD